MKPGRPSKFTAVLGKRAVALARKGLSLQRIPGKLGVSRSTLYEWIKLGEAEDAEDASPVLFAWALEFREAIADYELHLLAIATGKKVSPSRRRAALVLLERRYQDAYRVRQSIEHSGPDGGPIQTETRAPMIFTPPEASDEGPAATRPDDGDAAERGGGD